jgi:hypothetical protein
MEVYILKREYSHLIDMSYDIALLPFVGSENLKYQLLSQNEFQVPQPVKFLANFNVIPSNTDYPVADHDLEVMSNKMIATLKHVGPVKLGEFSTVFIDDTYIVDDRYDSKGNLKAEVPVVTGFSIVQILDILKAFDFENSDYKPLKSNPNFPGVIKKMVLKEPVERFPPLFRIFEQPSSVFVSQEARTALEANRIKGCVFQPVAVTS